jgi:hypothetical protein
MKLHAALGESLIHTRGPAGSETGAAWTKVLEIAEGLDDADYRLQALRGLWFFHISVGEYRVALTLAQRFCTLAANRPDPNDRLIGERMIGVSQHYLGDLPSARCHVERVLAHYVPPTRKPDIICPRRHTVLAGGDTGLFLSHRRSAVGAQQRQWDSTMKAPTCPVVAVFGVL